MSDNTGYPNGQTSTCAEKNTAPQAQAPAGVSLLGIASLLLGILSFTCACCLGLGILFAVTGAVCGHLGLSKIKSSNGALKGRTLCIAGLICSYLGIVAGIIYLAYLIFSICSTFAAIFMHKQ